MSNKDVALTFLTEPSYAAAAHRYCFFKVLYGTSKNGSPNDSPWHLKSFISELRHRPKTGWKNTQKRGLNYL